MWVHDPTLEKVKNSNIIAKYMFEYHIFICKVMIDMRPWISSKQEPVLFNK